MNTQNKQNDFLQFAGFIATILFIVFFIISLIQLWIDSSDLLKLKVEVAEMKTKPTTCHSTAYGTVFCDSSGCSK